MNQSNCQRCKNSYDSVKRIPKELECGCIICADCINNDLEYYDQFLCKAHKKVFKGKVTELKDFITTESFQKQLNDFIREAKLNQSLEQFLEFFNTQQMKYIKCKKIILKVQNFFCTIIQQVCQLQTKNICEILQGDLKRGCQIVEELRNQIESLEKIQNLTSENRQQHEERISMLNQVQAKYEITKQMIEAYQQVETEDYNESDIVLGLSESCFNAIQLIQDKAKNQNLEMQEVANLVSQFLFEKEQYDFLVLSSEKVGSFVKKFSSQVVSAAKLRENPLNKSNICQNQKILDQFKQYSSQRLIKNLNEVIELSNTSQEINQASANAITILKNLNPIFSQKNFEGIKIQGADLSDAIFQNCNLKNADLQKVNLTNAMLINCNCEGVNILNAILEKPDQSPILSGHTEGINSLAISPDSNYIVSGSVDKTIKIWDFQTGSCIRTLTEHSGAVLSVAITSDQK